MIHDLELLLLDRLRAALPADVPVLGTFEAPQIDEYGASSALVHARFEQAGGSGFVVGSAATFGLTYSCTVHVDLLRVTAEQRLQAAQLLRQIAEVLVGWEYSPGAHVRFVDGAQTQLVDGRILTLGIAFFLGAVVSGA